MARLTPRRDPNKVAVFGVIRNEEDSLVASEAIKFGALIEKFDDAGTTKWRLNSSVLNIVQRFVALDFPEANRKPADNISDGYEVGDTVMSGIFSVGSILSMRLASGQDIDLAEELKTGGTGDLRVATSLTAAANVAIFISNEDTGGVTAAIKRIEVQCVA